MNDGMTFGTTLKRLRADLSQEQLGEAAGVSRQAIDLLEKGQRQPSLETAERLAIALGKKLRVFEGCGVAEVDAIAKAASES